MTDHQPDTEATTGVIERISEPVFSFDCSLQLTSLNESAQSLLGSQPVGKHLSELEDDGLFALDEFEAVLETGREIAYERYVEALDCWYELRLFPGDGGLTVFCADITDHKQRKAALAEYERIVEATGDPVYLLDDDGCFTFVNEAFCSMTGYETGELIGSDTSVVVDEETFERGQAKIHSLLTADEAHETFELEVETRDGQRVPCENKLAVLRRDGQFGGVVGRLRDISDRLEREKALGRFRAFVENSSDIITHVDPDGTITYVSPTVETIIGQEPSSLVGENALEHVHPADESTYLDNFNALLEAPKKTVSFQYRFEHPTDSWIWVESTGTNQLANPAIEGILLVSREISERKEYQHQLERQRDNLRLLNQVVRHDIRNDLQLILTHSELLTQQLADEQTDSLEQITASTQNAIELTEKARTLSEVMLEPESATGSRPLRSVLVPEIEQTQAAHEDATVHIEGSVPEVRVRANEMLDSVFDNLLTNAVVHNDSPNPAVGVSVRTSDDTVVIRIADNGPGISDDRKDEVFARGEKGIESDGTGIGLYLVRTLVERYGGEIHIESRSQSDPIPIQGEKKDNEGEITGAVFVIELPRAN